MQNTQNTPALFNSLDEKVNGYYTSYREESKGVEGSEYKPNATDNIKTIHGIRHAEQTKGLATDLLRICQANNVDTKFTEANLKDLQSLRELIVRPNKISTYPAGTIDIAKKRTEIKATLLSKLIESCALYHDASRIHEDTDKNEIPNAQIFYNEALRSGYSTTIAILGGAIITCKSERDGVKQQALIKKFLTGHSDSGGDNHNAVIITKKLRGQSVTCQSVTDAVNKVHKLLSDIKFATPVVNLADSIEVMRVRFVDQGSIDKFHNVINNAFNDVNDQEQLKQSCLIPTGKDEDIGEFGVKRTVDKFLVGSTDEINQKIHKEITALINTHKEKCTKQGSDKSLFNDFRHHEALTQARGKVEQKTFTGKQGVLEKLDTSISSAKGAMEQEKKICQQVIHSNTYQSRLDTPEHNSTANKDTKERSSNVAILKTQKNMGASAKQQR